MVTTEPADLPLDTALFVSALQAWLAVERIDREVRTERRPSSSFDPLPGEPEDLGDRGPQVVVSGSCQSGHLRARLTRGRALPGMPPSHLTQKSCGRPC